MHNFVYLFTQFEDKTRRTEGTKEAFKSMQNGLLWACNSMLAAIEKNFYIPGLHIDFPEEKVRHLWMDCLGWKCREGCWEERATRAWMFFFSSVRVYGQMKECVVEAPLREGRAFYFNLSIGIAKDDKKGGWIRRNLRKLHYRVVEFKRFLARNFSKYYKSGLFAVSFIYWFTWQKNFIYLGLYLFLMHHCVSNTRWISSKLTGKGLDEVIHT